MKKASLVLLAVAVLFTMLAFAGDKGAGKSMNGWISDAHCGAKGAKAGHEDCAKKCAQMGEKLVFVPDAKDGKILNIDNQTAVQDHAGHHVAVKGTVNNDTLHVDSVTMLADNGKSGGSK